MLRDPLMVKNGGLQMQLVFEEKETIPNVRFLEKFGRSRYSDSLRMQNNPRLMCMLNVPYKCIVAMCDGQCVGIAVFGESESEMEIVHATGLNENIVADLVRHVVNGNTERPITLHGIEASPCGEDGEPNWEKCSVDEIMQRRYERHAVKEIGGLGKVRPRFVQRCVGDDTFGPRECYPEYSNAYSRGKRTW